MTTYISRLGARDAGPGTASRMSAFTRSVGSFGAIVLDAVEATRGVGSAHTTADRHAVLDRFVADVARDGERPAA